MTWQFNFRPSLGFMCLITGCCLANGLTVEFSANSRLYVSDNWVLLTNICVYKKTQSLHVSMFLSLFGFLLLQYPRVRVPMMSLHTSPGPTVNWQLVFSRDPFPSLIHRQIYVPDIQPSCTCQTNTHVAVHIYKTDRWHIGCMSLCDINYILN